MADLDYKDFRLFLVSNIAQWELNRSSKKSRLKPDEMVGLLMGLRMALWFLDKIQDRDQRLDETTKLV